MCDLIHAETARVMGRYGKDFYAGTPAVTANDFGAGRAYYVATRPEIGFLTAFYRERLAEAGVAPLVENLPDGVAVSSRVGKDGRYLFAMNFSGRPARVRLPDGENALTGERAGGETELGRQRRRGDSRRRLKIEPGRVSARRLEERFPMQKMILGRTGLEISRTGFGALPIQRVSFDEAAALLNRALDGGVCYIDTARAYTDSEEKIGRALSGRRRECFIATKTHAKTGENLNADLETSLRLLKTDAIDVYQFHNPPFVPVPGGEDGLYDAAVRAREAGKIRFIGITQHSIERAEQAVESGLYDTIQYPLTIWRPSARSRWCAAARRRTSASWR